MLTKKQLGEIREHLEKAQNPVFFYDNDVDGLCSCVLLRRFLGHGKGVAVKSHPDIDRNYARKVQELNADYVFVLDRPTLGKEFVDEIKNIGVPIVWIDHHDVGDLEYSYDNIYRFNPVYGSKKSNEPTTFLCYSATKRQEDSWIALIGSIADNYLPYFVDEFKEEYPEYWGSKVEKAFDGLYGTGIGRITRALS